jgi:hypothetical protein
MRIFIERGKAIILLCRGGSGGVTPERGGGEEGLALAQKYRFTRANVRTGQDREGV